MVLVKILVRPPFIDLLLVQTRDTDGPIEGLLWLNIERCPV